MVTYSLFFFNDTATTEIYTLSLHDALPISPAFSIPRKFVPQLTTCTELIERDSSSTPLASNAVSVTGAGSPGNNDAPSDRKSTRLNSSHANISYAVFCLKKKKIQHDA